MDAFADVVEQLRAAEQGPHHDAPEHPDPPRPARPDGEADPRDLRRPGSPRARAAATPSATSPATRWAGVCEDEVFDPTPYAGAYVRYFVRHPTTQLMPRKVKTAFDGTDERPRDHRHPRHRLPRARARRRHAASRCASAAARRSCRASRRRSYEFVERRRRRVPEGRRGRASGSSTARTGCASTAPAPASRSSSTRSASTPSARMVEEELQGDWVAERDFTPERLVRRTTRRPRAPGAVHRRREPERRPRRVRALPRGATSRRSSRRASPPSR